MLLLFRTSSCCTTTRIWLGSILIFVLIFVSNEQNNISKLIPSIIIKDTIVINTNNNNNNNFTVDNNNESQHNNNNTTSTRNDRNMFGIINNNNNNNNAFINDDKNNKNNNTQQQPEEEQQQQVNDTKNEQDVGMSLLLLGNDTSSSSSSRNTTIYYNNNESSLLSFVQTIDVNSLIKIKKEKNTKQKQQQQQKQKQKQKVCFESPSYPLRRFENTKKQKQKQPVQYSDILAGPGLSDVSSTYKVCLFRHDIDHSNHFPHAMQQLIRCFSWWFGTRTNSRNSSIDNNYNNNQWVLIFDHVKNIGRTSSFLQGLLRALVDAVNIKIVPNHTTTTTTASSAGFVYTNEHLAPYVTIHPQTDMTILRTKIIQYYNININDYNYNYNNDSYNDDDDTIALQSQLKTNITQQQKQQQQQQDEERRINEQQQKKQSSMEENEMNVTTTTATRKAKNGIISSDSLSLSLSITSYPRIGILNRQLREQRRIINIDRIVNVLQEQNFSTLPITIEYFNGKTFLQQVTFYANHDIILTSHGAQLTGLVFMPTPCSAILEIFPESWIFPEFFGSLAIASNVEYYYLILSDPSKPENLYKWYNSTVPGRRRRARQLCPPVTNIVAAIQQIVSDWKVCIEKKNNRYSKRSTNNTNTNNDDGG